MSSRLPRALPGVLMLFTLGLAGTAMAGPDAAPPVITVTATDFAFDAPETVPAGAVTFRLVNHGEAFHHGQLVRLDDGKTPEDLEADVGPGTGVPDYATFVGGPGLAAPGAEAEATVDLRPGTYYWLCFIENDDGPHLAQGMVHRFEVEPGPREPLPDADNTMMLTDYEFKLGHPITAGRTVIRVRNYAAQPHEVALLRFAPGKTLDDLRAFMEAGEEGEPPAMPIGGMQALSQGLAGNLTLDLEPGHYGLVCFVPDVQDGQPHAAHGMVHEFDVE